MSPDIFRIFLGFVLLLLAFKFLKNTIKLVMIYIIGMYIVVNFIGINNLNEIIKYIGKMISNFSCVGIFHNFYMLLIS